MHQQQTAFKNIMGKGEIARNEQFLLFPQCFLLNQIIISPLIHIFDIISLFAAEFEKLKVGISGKGLKGENAGNQAIKVKFCHFGYRWFNLKFCGLYRVSTNGIVQT